MIEYISEQSRKIERESINFQINYSEFSNFKFIDGIIYTFLK